MDLKFTKPTDQEHKIKLESSLVSAHWLSGVAIGGQTAALEVLTAFVGYGAPIQIIARSEKGKKLGKLTGKVKGDKYVGEVTIPDNLEPDDRIYFEVKLPKSGVSGESNHVRVVPQVRVSNLKWSAREARRGDIVKLSADISGLPDQTEVAFVIYEYDRDRAHDRIVELPVEVANGKVELDWEYEYHEDTDEVPTEEELRRYDRHYNPPEYFFTVKVDETEYGSTQESGLLEFKDYIELSLTTPGGAPVPNAKYYLLLADGSEREGQLDDQGRAREDDVPPGPFSVYYSEADE